MTVGIGLAGSGYMGRSYAECITRYTAGGRLAAIFGGTRATQLGADYGAPVEPTFEALLARPDVDAVLLATPHSAHLPQAQAAAAAGKQIYLEKPMARSVARSIRATIYPSGSAEVPRPTSTPIQKVPAPSSATSDGIPHTVFDRMSTLWSDPKKEY